MYGLQLVAKRSKVVVVCLNWGETECRYRCQEVGDPPVVAKITSAAHAAIMDDRTVDREVRVAVLFDLEFHL